YQARLAHRTKARRPSRRPLRQKQDAQSACATTAQEGVLRGNGRPGWHRESIRAETATQTPHTSRGVYNSCLVHLQDSADYACSKRGESLALWTKHCTGSNECFDRG